MSRPTTRRRRNANWLGALALTLASAHAPAQEAEGIEAYRETASRIIAAATADHFAWERIAELTDTFGHRFSGSPQLEAALAWAADRMRQDGLENVRLEPVRVPRWIRGHESVHIAAPAPVALPMLGLGNSVGTPPDGIEAELLVVSSFEDLEANAEQVRGRIVLFDVPFTNYGETVRYRGDGASRAARLGARAMLLRSVGLPGLRTPHTGALRYAEDAPKIPAAALAYEDAERLHRMQDRGQRVVVRLKMEAHFDGEADSANLVGEIVGREKPDEIVVVGGHIDSWDVGTGAVDDAGGCVVTWDALRILRSLDLRPRRTLRVVLWTNEENGLKGPLAYRDAHQDELARHVLALESDSGAYRPVGFRFTGSDEARATVERIAALLEPIGATAIAGDGGGADIGPLVKEGVPGMLLDVEGSGYFMVHHTEADTVSQLDPTDVAAGVAAVAVMGYVVADLPDALPRIETPADRARRRGDAEARVSDGLAG